MNRIRSACVRTNSSKNCFVSLSGDLAEAIGLRIQGQPFALQLQWENGKAFASWSGEVTHGKRGDILNDSSSIVQIGKKFADGLGLDDDQQVLVEPVVGIPSCNRINVDPVSANDWEILELHAGYIESQLLNQVRVVFPGQILPIWIENNMCVVVQIVNLEPDANCVRLDEFTEVIVSPKTRTFSRGKQPQQAPVHFGKENTEQGNKMHAGTSAENKYASTSNVSCFDDGDQLSSWPSPSRTTNAEEQNGIANSGFLSRVSCYLQSFFNPCDEENPVNENQTCKPLNPEEIKNEENWKPLSSIMEKGEKCGTDSGDDSDFEMYLRVQPNIKGDPEVSNKGSTVESMNFYSQQPTTVFVDITSLPPLLFKSWTCNWETFPPPDGTVEKTVQIRKLLSPKERTALQKNRSPSNNNENQGPQSQETSTDIESNQVTGQSPPDSTSLDMLPPHWVVRMVMTSSLNRASVDPNSHELGVEEHVLPEHVILTKELCKMLGARDLCLVKIQNVSSGPSDLQGMVLHPFAETEQKLQDISADTVMDAFQGWISMVCSVEIPLVLCSGTLLSFDAKGQLCQFVVKVLSHQEMMKSGGEPSYYHLTPETLNNVTVVIGTPQNSLKGFCEFISAQEIKLQFPKYSVNDLGGVTDVFHKCLDHALSTLGQRPLSNQLGGNIISGLCGGAVLICGSGTGAGIGCGKTSLAHAVCYQLQEWPVCAHVTLVDCIPFRGKRVDTIQKQWQQIFLEAAWHQPSVILFDDLDQVVSAPSALQEMGGEALYKHRLAQVFKDLISTEINNNSRIVVIATSKSHDSLHPSLLTSRGCHVFQCRAELHPPDADQRQQILSAMMAKLFRHRDCDKLELSLLAKKTEGFSPRDLQSLLDRALHKAAVRKMTTSAADGGICSAITPEDFEKAFEGFTPAALRGVSLHTAGELGWSDVGGLSGVKAALMETLLWPTKYSWLFSKCPLRLRSGLLLYGPPGTGKTLLAGVVAKECGLNFISIKGPELLSKYIGASEQAVRDMFTRAQSAKPCILFFDEFDSLAPRRGHDSTGVTDRVVNQLLTQLDGVEGLDGVYILAATSRPDLIDPALLRPGRLDKCLFCGIPTKSERLQILEALSRSVTLSEDINLAVISDMCEHFTGADFKALLYNAQLAAIHRNANNSQLYKAMFKNTEMESTEKYDRCAETDVVTEEDRDSVIYVPSLTEGSIQLSTEELTKLHSEVTTLHKNLQHRKSKRKALQSNSAENEVTFGIQINQSDLFQAASAAGPSVSDSERRRYQAIYETFVKSRGGDFSLNTPGHGKATLA